MMDRFWNNFNVETQEHFYHGGGHIENRHSMIEALVFNFELHEPVQINQFYRPRGRELQLELNLA